MNKYVNPISFFNGDYSDFIVKIDKNLDKIDPADNYFRLNYMHKTTKFKIKSSEYHLNRIIDLFREGSFGSLENQEKIRAEIDAFFFSLKSSLDLLAQEIKIVFSINDIPEKRVNIDIIKDYLVSKNEKLGLYLKSEMDKNWYSDFKIYRDVTSHRLMPIMQVGLIFGDKSKLSSNLINKKEELKGYTSEEEIKKYVDKIFNISLVSNHIRELYLRDDPSDVSPNGNYSREIFSDCIYNLLIIKAVINQAYQYFMLNDS